ncbi:type IV toxin-antitoxin system AbiEi family antitoxin domain-containing protein [Oryzobacter terrae]|uniref:type IV toxin-antitoxin system AbiEi family antitoxin domain-containing protein n=1 Tax=Oryzobacter terrae TaxID=1620385 RepID=UPI00366CCB72
MSDHLLSLAATRGGVLTTRDADLLDVDAHGLAALVRSRDLVRVRQGAYVLGTVWGDAHADERLALRCRAVLRSRTQAGRVEAATHQSALALHGLPVHGAPLDVVDLAGRVTRARLRAGLRVRPTDERIDVVEVDGLRVAVVGAALAQVALCDGRDPFVVAGDRALASRAVDAAEIDAWIGRLSETRRELVRATRWLSQLDAASESVGETRARLLLHDLGHPTTSQVRVADAAGVVVARVDLLVGDRVVIEFDGLVKYDGPGGRAALAAEKRREDLLRSLGYEVVRLTWADLSRPRRVDALVRAALARVNLRSAG